MERFLIDLDVLCSDGVASDDDPAGESSDVGSDVYVVPGSDTDRSIRADSSYRKVDGPVCHRPGRVSRTSAVARTFGPAVSEEYSPVVFVGGGGGGSFGDIIMEGFRTRIKLNGVYWHLPNKT